MNVLILAAGMGTRLKPWTLYHPKALAPVGGIPMLERVLLNLRHQGFDHIVVNVHHFSNQIIEFLESKDFGVEISISDETGRLLDTGGGIVKASEKVDFGKGPLLIHNVDILSNANLRDFMDRHNESGDDATLLVSERDSQRRLMFDGNMELAGWHNISTGEYVPSSVSSCSCEFMEYSFSGIHIMNEGAIKEMAGMRFGDAFPVMRYYLSATRRKKVCGVLDPGLKLIDIGKPATLSQAQRIFQ